MAAQPQRSAGRFFLSSSSYSSAAASGFDAALWQGLAELGAFGLRVPEEAGANAAAAATPPPRESKFKSVVDAIQKHF